MAKVAVQRSDPITEILPRQTNASPAVPAPHRSRGATRYGGITSPQREFPIKQARAVAERWDTLVPVAMRRIRCDGVWAS